VALLAELRGRVPRFGKKIEALEFLDREVSTGSAPDARLAEVLRGYLSVAELFVQERPEDALDLYRRGESFVRQIHDKALRTTWAEEYQRELGRMRTRAN
jgi:hypothetical protein